MTRLVENVGWLFSPTRKVVDMRVTGMNPQEKALFYQSWNKWFFWIDVILGTLLSLSLVPTLPFLGCWLILILPWSRCNEISYAFYKDILDRLEHKDPESSLTASDRIRLAMKSYFGLVVNFAVFYYFFPIEGKFEPHLATFFDAIYFRGSLSPRLAMAIFNHTNGP